MLKDTKWFNCKLLGWMISVCEVQTKLFPMFFMYMYVGKNIMILNFKKKKIRLGIWGTFMMVKERRNEVDFGKVVDSPSRWPLKWDKWSICRRYE